MKMSWYTHPDPLDYDTATELIARYAARNIPTQKTLATDPRFWLVSALLPCSEREPKQDRRYQQKFWR